MECKFFNWDCVISRMGPLFKHPIKFIINFFTLTSFFFVFALIMIIIGYVLKGNSNIVFYIVTYNILGEFLITAGGAIVSGYIVKYLIAGNTFAEAISSIMIENFTSYEFIKNFSEKKIREIIKIFQRCHQNMFIEINEDKIKKQKSIEKLEQYFKKLKESIIYKTKNNIELDKHEEFIKNKNYIVSESISKTTAYCNNLEIIHKEYKIKIIENGDFEFEYKFQPQFSEVDLSWDNFSESNDRFKEYSYSHKEIFYPKKGQKRQKLNISFSTKKEDNNWFVVSFRRTSCIPGDTIILEFALSLPGEFRENIFLEDKSKAPKSNFLFPHAYRKFLFQKEIYDQKNKISIQPILKIGAKNSDAVESNNLFYQIYEWDIYYSNEDYNNFVFTFE